MRARGQRRPPAPSHRLLPQEPGGRQQYFVHNPGMARGPAGAGTPGRRGRARSGSAKAQTRPAVAQRRSFPCIYMYIYMHIERDRHIYLFIFFTESL